MSVYDKRGKEVTVSGLTSPVIISIAVTQPVPVAQPAPVSQPAPVAGGFVLLSPSDYQNNSDIQSLAAFGAQNASIIRHFLVSAIQHVHGHPLLRI